MKNLTSNLAKAKNLSSADCCAAKAAATTVATIIKSFDHEE